MLYPLNISKINTEFYKNWKKENTLNVLPFSVNKLKLPLFKMSLGLMLETRLMLHPAYNDNSNISLGGNNFNVNDLFNNNNFKLAFPYHLSTQNGFGVDFTLESKYFAMSSVLSLIFGECYRTLTVNEEDPFNVNGTEIKDFQCNYTMKELSIITNFSFLPYGIFLPSDSPIRIYSGLGFFLSLWYKNYSETISGQSNISNNNYNFDSTYSNINSFLMPLGIFPEVGIIYKFLKFNLKFGIAYNFDLYKYIFISESNRSNIDTFNTSNLEFKIACGYYLN